MEKEKEPKDYWSEDGQAFFHCGKGYGLTDTLQTIRLDIAEPDHFVGVHFLTALRDGLQFATVVAQSSIDAITQLLYNNYIDT